MKKVIVSIALIAATASALAACPIGTRYQCFSTPSGKMQCGCY
jgi:hypothetical protein